MVILQNWSLYPHTLMYSHGTWTQSFLDRVTHVTSQTWVQTHLVVNDLWFKFLLKRVTVSTYFDVFSWDLDPVILSYSHTCTSTDLGSKVILGSMTIGIHILLCIFNLIFTMIAKVCDREGRRDSWFDNRLVVNGHSKFVL